VPVLVAAAMVAVVFKKVLREVLLISVFSRSSGLDPDAAIAFPK
jgi:hypothetical protein